MGCCSFSAFIISDFYMNKWLLTLLLLFPVALINAQQKKDSHLTYSHGCIVRGDSSKKEIALVFSADEFGDGLFAILKTLHEKNIQGAFFFTGRFYRNKNFQSGIQQLQANGNYLGPHSDQHLLYNDWNNRDSMLVSFDSFRTDIHHVLLTMKKKGLPVHQPHLFMPPYEWWNDTVARWSARVGLRLINFTPGIRTNADYTYPELGKTYKSSEWLLRWIKEKQQSDPNAFNGVIMLIHAGTDPRRTDKLYDHLGEIIDYLETEGYTFKRLDKMLE